MEPILLVNSVKMIGCSNFIPATKQFVVIRAAIKRPQFNFRDNQHKHNAVCATANRVCLFVLFFQQGPN